MLGVYEGVLVCALAFEIYVCYLALNVVDELRNANNIIKTGGEDVPFTYYENNLARRINKIFYGASSKCPNGKKDFFYFTSSNIKLFQ